MAGGTTNAFELVFGVKGVEANGASYELIKEQIGKLANNLKGQQELNLKFGVDSAALEASIKSALSGKTFNVNVAANVSQVASQAASAASAQGATPAAASNASAAASATTKTITKHIASAKAEVIKLNQAIAGTSKGTQKYAELTAQLAQAEERYKNLVAQAQKFLSTQGAADVTKAVDASKAVTNAQNKQNMAIAVAQDEYNALIQKAQEYMATANQLKTSGALPKDGATPVGDKYATAVGNFISQYKESLAQSKFSATSYGDQIEWLKKLAASWQEVLKTKRDYENESLGRAKIVSKVEDEIAKLQKAGYAPGTSGRDYIGELQQIKSDALAGTKSIRDLNRSFFEIKGSITSTKAEVETFGHAMQRAFSEKFKYLIASMGFMYLRRSIRDLINNVKELDAAMTQIEIVTGESSAALEKFGKQAAKTAKEVGASVTDVIKSTETYARLGYSLNDALRLADVTAKYSNVAATDTESATSALTSIMKAFNYEPEQMEGVVDMLVKVGQEYAISAGELGDALQRGGAALAVGGATLEETIAIMTAGNAAVQNADTVGNALKSVSARIRTSTAELEEMGEEVDDLVSSSSKYRKEILALSGVDIMKNDNTYKSVYQILTEIAAVYDKLDDTSKARLLEDLGGKRNATVIGSIISNLDDLTGSYEAATNAAGTLAEANAIYLDSIEGKTKQLKSSWQTLSAGILDGAVVKAFVDGARIVLDVFNKIDEATHGLTSTILSAYIGFNLIVAAFKTLSGMSFFQNFGALVAGSFTKIIAAFSGVGAAATAAGNAAVVTGAEIIETAYTTGAAVTGAATATGAEVSGVIATVGTEAAAAGGIAISALGALAAAAAAVVAIFAGITMYKKAHPSMEKLKADFEEASNKAKDYKSQQEEVNSKIEELHKRQANGERTTEIEEELGILQSQNQALETQIKLYEELAKAKNAEIKKQESEAAKKYFTQSTQTRLVQGEQVAMSDLQGSAKVQQQIEEYKKLSDQIANAATSEEVERLEKQRDAIQEWFTYELEIIREFIDDPTYGKEASSLVDLISSVILGGMDNLTDEAEQKADDLADAIIPKTIDTVKKQIEAMEGAVDEYEKYGGLTQDTIDDLKNAIPGLVEALYDQNGELTEAGIAALKSDSALRTFAEDTIKAAKTINGMSFDEAKKELAKLEASFYATAIGSRTMAKAMEISDLKKAIAEAQADIEATIGGWSKYNPDAGKSGSKKDTFKEGLENRIKVLKHQLEMEKITQEKYYDELDAIRKEYMANTWRDEYHYEEEITSLEEEIFSGRRSLLTEWIDDQMFAADRLADSGAVVSTSNDEMSESLKRLRGEYKKTAQAWNEMNKNGNVDYNNRPWKTNAEMFAAGWNSARDKENLPDGVGITTYTQGFYGSDFSTALKGNLKKYVEITPIMDNGTVLSPAALEQYMENIFKQADILQADKIANGGKGLIVNVWDNPTDKELDEYFEALQEIKDKSYDLWQQIQKTSNAGQSQVGIYQVALQRVEYELSRLYEEGKDDSNEFVQSLLNDAKELKSKIVDTISSIYDEYESYANDFNMWGKKGFSKNDFYDNDLAQLEAMYKKGYLTELEYLDRYNEIQKKRFDFHNESLNEIIDLTIEMIEKETDEVTDAIDEEIDAYDELIQKKKELLQNAEDEADYEEEVADAVKEITKLQSKISQLSLDNSREAAAKRAELEERLAEKQKELSKTQRDHALEQTNEALDDSLDAFKEEKEAEKKVAEESIDTWMEKYEKAIDMLDSDWEGTYKKLTKYVEKYATSIDGPNSLKTSWEAVRDIMQECAKISFSGALAYGTNGANYGKNPSEILNGSIGDLTALSVPNVYVVDRSGKSPSEAKNGDYVVTGGGIYIKGSNVNPLPLTPYIGKATTGDYAEVQKAYEEFKKRGIPTFHSGGIVGSGIKVGDKEVMTLLENGEWVLDGKRQNTLKELLAQIGQAATYATAIKASGRAVSSYSQVGNSFAPHVEVNIQHSGSMSDEDAKHYGDVAADAALEKLRIAFNRRGI